MARQIRELHIVALTMWALLAILAAVATAATASKPYPGWPESETQTINGILWIYFIVGFFAVYYAGRSLDWMLGRSDGGALLPADAKVAGFAACCLWLLFALLLALWTRAVGDSYSSAASYPGEYNFPLGLIIALTFPLSFLAGAGMVVDSRFGTRRDPAKPLPWYTSVQHAFSDTIPPSPSEFTAVSDRLDEMGVTDDESDGEKTEGGVELGPRWIRLDDYARENAISTSVVLLSIDRGTIPAVQLDGEWFVHSTSAKGQPSDQDEDSSAESSGPNWNDIYEKNGPSSSTAQISIEDPKDGPTEGGGTSPVKEPTWWGPANSAAQIAFVCGVTSIFLFAFLLPPLVATISGFIALETCKNEPHRGGKGAAITGVVLGILYLIVWAWSVGMFS